MNVGGEEIVAIGKHKHIQGVVIIIINLKLAEKGDKGKPKKKSSSLLFSIWSSDFSTFFLPYCRLYTQVTTRNKKVYIENLFTYSFVDKLHWDSLFGHNICLCRIFLRPPLCCYLCRFIMTIRLALDFRHKQSKTAF